MRVLVVYVHPRTESLCAAALGRVRSALEAGGHDFRVRDLYAAGFDPVVPAGSPGRTAESDPAVSQDLELLEWAEAVVFVYPTWWGGQPAMLKGWFDRVLDAGGAYAARGRRPRMGGVRRVLVVTTHGSSKWVNSLQGEPGKRVVLRGFRSLVGRRARTRWIAAYGLDGSTEEYRTSFLDRVEREVGRL